MLETRICLQKNEAPLRLPGAEEPFVLAGITTDGYYRRRSKILNAEFILEDPDGSFELVRYEDDDGEESAEYSILEKLISCLHDKSTFFTFGGMSFLVPFVSAKCRLYGLPDPFEGKKHVDMSALFRPLYTFLRLPSRRMEDYLKHCGKEDAPALSKLTRLLPFLDLLEGRVTAEGVCADPEKNSVVFTMRMIMPVPEKLVFRAGSLILSAEGETALLSSRLFDGKIRMYYDDPGDYLFLPEEGFAVHRSVGCFLPKERVKHCTYDTCFTLVSPDPVLQGGADAQEKYLLSVFTYFRRACGVRA